jgi:hypothetical protein
MHNKHKIAMKYRLLLLPGAFACLVVTAAATTLFVSPAGKVGATGTAEPLS